MYYVSLNLNNTQGKISCKYLHVLCTERALKMSPFLQETCKTCKNCARNFTFLAQFLASSKNLVRNLQGARILHVKCPFSCSVSRILQDIFPWVVLYLIVENLQPVHMFLVCSLLWYPFTPAQFQATPSSTDDMESPLYYIIHQQVESP